MRVLSFSIATAAALLLIAGSSSTIALAENTCPVTLAPATAFIPPSPYPKVPPRNQDFWFGNAKLWTRLPKDGTWKLGRVEGSYGQKILWWHEGYDWKADPQPNLKVTAKRLDAPAPPLDAGPSTNGFNKDLQSFMLSGLEFQTVGCWEITGAFENQKVTFVVLVVE